MSLQILKGGEQFRHIRPGNTAACPCCGERRFRSATGAVAHLESGNCLKLAFDDH